MKTTNFREYLKDALQDPETKDEFDALEPIYAFKHQLMEIRIREKLTQAELAQKIGIPQSALARLESGKSIPTLRTLQKIAKGLGKKLVLSFQ